MAVQGASSGSGGMVTGSRRSKPTSAASTRSSTSISIDWERVDVLARPLPEFRPCRAGEDGLHVETLTGVVRRHRLAEVPQERLRAAVDAVIAFRGEGQHGRDIDHCPLAHLGEGLDVHSTHLHSFVDRYKPLSTHLTAGIENRVPDAVKHDVRKREEQIKR